MSFENKSKINLNGKYKAKDLINIMRAKDCLVKSAATFIDDGKVYEIRVNIKIANNESK